MYQLCHKQFQDGNWLRELWLLLFLLDSWVVGWLAMLLDNRGGRFGDCIGGVPFGHESIGLVSCGSRRSESCGRRSVGSRASRRASR